MANENATKIQLRHDSSANWFANNPILAEGEVGIEIDKNRMKVGNGVSHYNDLEYFSDTVDYNELINKPQINSIGLMGNLSLHELGIQAKGNYLVSSDLNNYALKSELPTNTSDLTNDSGFLTSIPSEYVTETELNSSLEDKADTATTLSGYGITDAYTKTEADGKYATKTELSNKADTSALSNYATTSALTEGLAEKADTSALPASTSLMNGTAPSVADFAGADAEGLKTELNAFLAQLKTRGVIA